MLFGAFATVSLILAVLTLYFGARVLGKFGWFFDWLRGMVGLLLVAVAVVFVLVGLDLLTYKEIFSEKPLLTISIEKKAEQHFLVTLLDINESAEESYEVFGDQWQVDARIIRWKGLLQTFGAKPGYRLDRLSGRYYSLEDERRKTRSVHSLASSEYGLDMWAWVQEHGRFMPFFDAVYGSAAYLPMEDGAIFQVSLGVTGLVARPMNTVAEQAIKRWQ